ncbi:exported hypothetical protein [Cupriavidus phytorum]|uniref:Uncharacterized protein n=1 Tax=Cupriavidus taiwanensis TaxID=164546 RepID=A0A975X6S7_9BURK|nr:exported hypothetical protein [Cupriavidus taiwanensis]
MVTSVSRPMVLVSMRASSAASSSAARRRVGPNTRPDSDWMRSRSPPRPRGEREGAANHPAVGDMALEKKVNGSTATAPSTSDCLLPSPACGRGEQTSASIVLPTPPSRNPRETPDPSGAHFASPLAAPCHSLRNNAMTACRAALLCKACVGHAPRMAP